MNAMTRWMSVVLSAVLSLACSSSSDTPPAAPAFAQADLTDDWDALQLTTNDSPRWGHTHLSVAADGRATLVSMLQNDGPVTLPPTFDMKLSVSSSGTVTSSGADGGASFRGSMSSSKALVFATSTEDDGSTDLFVIRKRVPGVTFSAADVASVAFAYHAISSGSAWRWEYGDGATDASGALTIGHTWQAAGPVTPPPAGFATLSIDAAGLVEFAGAPGVMRGVMAADKKSLFLLNTPTPGTPPEVQLIGVLLTRTGFTAASLEGRYGFHLVESGSSSATSGWSRGAFAVNAQGVVSFSSYASSAGSTTLPSPFTLAIDAGGSITRADDASFHGHMAWNGDFYVRTGNATADPANGFLAIGAK